MNSFVTELISWIEDNLDKKLALDDVASRAGYSKWHLQRIFRQETGMPLATYIRRRRLTESAGLLKMTGLPVIEIAERFTFSNQQAYTRTFTSHFSIPPDKYRRSEGWPFNHLQQNLVHKKGHIGVPEFRQLSFVSREKVILSYCCPVDKIRCVNFHFLQRRKAFQKASDALRGRPIRSVAERFTPAESPDNLTVNLIFSGDLPAERNHTERKPGSSESEIFLCFPFRGNALQLLKMQIDVYSAFLPGTAFARRDAHDLFIASSDWYRFSEETLVTGFYNIPVSRECGRPIKSAAGEA